MKLLISHMIRNAVTVRWLEEYHLLYSQQPLHGHFKNVEVMRESILQGFNRGVSLFNIRCHFFHGEASLSTKTNVKAFINFLKNTRNCCRWVSWGRGATISAHLVRYF